MTQKLCIQEILSHIYKLSNQNQTSLIKELAIDYIDQFKIPTNTTFIFKEKNYHKEYLKHYKYSPFLLGLYLAFYNYKSSNSKQCRINYVNDNHDNPEGTKRGQLLRIALHHLEKVVRSKYVAEECLGLSLVNYLNFKPRVDVYGVGRSCVSTNLRMVYYYGLF